jgi:probable rRNA maturation factor
MNTYQITVQRVETAKVYSPKNTDLKYWAMAALTNNMKSAELTIRIVGIEEMTGLNERYRHKQGPTNVLSFPFDMPREWDKNMPLLGDIIICAKIVNQEAKQQKKTRIAHWAHMVVHGVLHLLGYDHEIEKDAVKMELHEVTILKSLGFPNPYHIAEKGLHNGRGC